MRDRMRVVIAFAVGSIAVGCGSGQTPVPDVLPEGALERGHVYDLFQPIPTPPPVVPGACVLGQGPDGAALPTGFPTTAIGVQVGETLPDFTACLANSTAVDFHAYAFLGNVVMIVFGTGWAPPVQSQAQEIEALYQTYGYRGFIPVTGFLHGYSNPSPPSAAFLDQFAATSGTTYPLLADPSMTLAQYYKPGDEGAVPLVLVVDRDGVVRYNQVGTLQMPAAEDAIEAALNSPGLAY